MLGVRSREVHRHVEVGRTRREGSVEDRRVQARVTRVHDRVGAQLARERGHRGRVGGVDRGRGQTPILERRDGPFGARPVDVGDGQVLEEVPPGRDGHERRADAAGADHEDAHPPRLATRTGV